MFPAPGHKSDVHQLCVSCCQGQGSHSAAIWAAARKGYMESFPVLLGDFAGAYESLFFSPTPVSLYRGPTVRSPCEDTQIHPCVHIDKPEGEGKVENGEKMVVLMLSLSGSGAGKRGGQVECSIALGLVSFQRQFPGSGTGRSQMKES